MGATLDAGFNWEAPMPRLSLLLTALALAFAGAAGGETLPPAMKVLPNASKLEYVGQALGPNGVPAGFYVDPTTLKRVDAETSILAVEAAGSPAGFGRGVQFVEERFYFDCSKQTFKLGDFAALDARGKTVERQDGVSPAADIPEQSIQALIRRGVCR
jgi:hypothetical protein